MFIPIKDDQPTIRFPHFTIGLIFINVAVFLYSQTLGQQGFERFMVLFGFTPELFFDFGANYNAPSWLLATPVTSMFLHGGWMHLIGNMLFLWIFGNNIEDYFGPVRFLLFYLVSGIAAVAVYTLFNPSSSVPLVGASGAIAGVMGAYMVLHPKARVTVLIFFFFIFLRQFPAKLVLGFWFVYQLYMSLMSGLVPGAEGGVAFLAHVGGFIFGNLLLRAMLKFKGRGAGPSDGQRVYRVHW